MTSMMEEFNNGVVCKMYHVQLIAPISPFLDLFFILQNIITFITSWWVFHNNLAYCKLCNKIFFYVCVGLPSRMNDYRELGRYVLYKHAQYGDLIDSIKVARMALHFTC
jgi:hypothetical protein